MKKILFVISVSLISFNILCHSSASEAKELSEGQSQVVAIDSLKDSLDTLTKGMSDTEAAKVRNLNNVARFIAAMPVEKGTELNLMTKSEVWGKYHNDANKQWSKFGKFTNNLKAWSATNLPAMKGDAQTLFYPFSGPDFLFADIFFPKAKNIIMIGLEPAGTTPVIDTSMKNNMKNVLEFYKIAIQDVISFSFFLTNNMKDEMTNQTINGTTPILMLFLARTGKQIIDVIPMNIGTDGRLTPAQYVKGKNDKHPVVVIKYKNANDNIIRTVTYVSGDLADPALKVNIALRRFLDNIDNNCVTFVKSASYLMHKPYFSTIRNTVMSKSRLILQDDSGIAYQAFTSDIWDISLHGSYSKPIRLFDNYYQPQLYEDAKAKAKPMKFRIGYNIKSILILAEKKKVKSN